MHFIKKLCWKQKKLRNSSRDKDVLEAETAKSEAQSAEWKGQLAQIDQELDALQQKLVETSAEVEKWEGRRLLSLEKQRNNDQQIERLQNGT